MDPNTNLPAARNITSDMALIGISRREFGPYLMAFSSPFRSITTRSDSSSICPSNPYAFMMNRAISIPFLWLKVSRHGTIDVPG
jgi:hypothetical protein